MIPFHEFMSDAAIQENKASSWITANKADFIALHEDDWEPAIYAEAWKLFGKLEPILVERSLNIDDIAAWFNKQMHGSEYKLAFEALLDVMKRKAVENKGKHDIFYYASKVAKSYRNVDGRELAKMYQDAVSESEAVANTTGGVATSDSPFKVGKVAGCDCIEVDHDTYVKCKFGKKPYARWSGYVEDEKLRTFVQKHYSKSKSLMIVNAETGGASYFRR